MDLTQEVDLPTEDPTIKEDQEVSTKGAIEVLIRALHLMSSPMEPSAINQKVTSLSNAPIWQDSPNSTEESISKAKQK